MLNMGFLKAQPPTQPQIIDCQWSLDGEVGMDSFEVRTHSFIVKIWLEETVEETGHALWRGHITYVPDHERRYVQDLDGITAFIAHYLQRMGVRLGLRWRVAQWLTGRWLGRFDEQACIG